MPLGLQNAYMGASVQEALRQRIADQIAEEERQRRALVSDRQLAQGDERLALDREELNLRAQPQPEKPVVIEGKLVKPTTGEVIGDFTKPPAPERPFVINGRLVKPSGDVISDFSTPPVDPQIERKEWEDRQLFQENLRRGRPQQQREPMPLIFVGPEGLTQVTRGQTPTATPVVGADGKPLGPTPTGAQKVRAADADVAIKELGRLRDSYKPEYVGPIAGRVRSGLQKTPLVPGDPGFAKFKSNTAIFRNQTIKAITGAQMSEREADRIRQQIPEENDKPEVWTEKAKATEQNLRDIMAANGRGVSLDDYLQQGSSATTPASDSSDLMNRLNARRKGAAK